MPPKKSATKKKEDIERQKRILATKEKILATKRMILSIIEVMIEKDVSKEYLLTNCTKLCQAEYNDVVAERSIEKICGYPMCSNIIKQTLKQKYHISRVSNKVYDLTERKCFCSNECYKASNYLRAQLSPIPLHMRKEEKIKISLLSESDNRGSAGEEIEFHYKIPKEEVNKVYSQEINKSNNFQSMLNEEIKKCADSLGELQIKEHIYETEYVFGNESPEKPQDSVLDERGSDLDNTSDDDSEDEKLFPSYDNVSVLTHRHMPIPEKVKRSVLITPKRPETNINSPAKELSLDFVHGVFKDWMTEDTLKFLLGEKYVYEVKADLLFEKMTDSDSANSAKLESIKNEYIKLCLKIDSLPDDDDFSDSTEFDIVNESKKLQNENSSAKTSFKRRPKRSNKSKNVAFSSETENLKISETESVLSEKKKVEAVHQIEENMKQLSFNEKNAETRKENCSNKDETEKLSTEEEPIPELAFPLVDSVSQNILRRQVLTSKLKAVYTELLPVAGLHYTDIREAVRKFVDSLSLTPTNIIFKPKEWKIISLVLFRVLTRTVLKDIYDELQLAKLCEEIPIEIDLREMEKLVCDIVSIEDIIL